MKVINRMITGTIIEIVVVISLVFISIPIWEKINLDEYASVAMYYENMSYNYLEVSDYSDYVLYQTTEEIAKEKIEPINLKLANDSNTKEEYAIWMIIYKTSTLDYQTIKIDVDNNTKKLKELETYEDEEAYYFLLFEGDLTGAEISKNVMLWIDKESVIDISNKYLEFDFQNIQRQIL